MKTVTGRLVLDEYVASVVEFMEGSLPADQLQRVAERLPALARVIWATDRSATVEYCPLSHDLQPSASEYALAAGCVGDGSEAEEGSHEPKPCSSRILRSDKHLSIG